MGAKKGTSKYLTRLEEISPWQYRCTCCENKFGRKDTGGVLEARGFCPLSGRTELIRRIA